MKLDTVLSDHISALSNDEQIRVYSGNAGDVSSNAPCSAAHPGLTAAIARHRGVPALADTEVTTNTVTNTPAAIENGRGRGAGRGGRGPRVSKGGRAGRGSSLPAMGAAMAIDDSSQTLEEPMDEDEVPPSELPGEGGPGKRKRGDTPGPGGVKGKNGRKEGNTAEGDNAVEQGKTKIKNALEGSVGKHRGFHDFMCR